MKLRVVTSILAVALTLSAAPPVEQVLTNMDKAAANWTGMRANTVWTQYTKLVDDSSAEKGAMAVQRADNGRVDLRIQFNDPYPRDLLVRGTQVEIYKPKIQTLEEYDVSKSKDKLEQALLSGFGVSGKFLSEHYEVKAASEEKVGEQQTVRLELTPKDASMKESVTHIEMWVSTSNWQPVQQRLHQPNGDHRTYLYSNVELNPKLKDSDFRLDIPKKAKREKKQL